MIGYVLGNHRRLVKTGNFCYGSCRRRTAQRPGRSGHPAAPSPAPAASLMAVIWCVCARADSHSLTTGFQSPLPTDSAVYGPAHP